MSPPFTAAPASNVCHICGKGFVREAELRNHVRITHSDKRAHKCMVCAAAGQTNAFKTNNALRRHIHTVHTSTRDFFCDGKDTLVPSSLWAMFYSVSWLYSFSNSCSILVLGSFQCATVVPYCFLAVFSVQQLFHTVSWLFSVCNSCSILFLGCFQCATVVPYYFLVVFSVQQLVHIVSWLLSVFNSCFILFLGCFQCATVVLRPTVTCSVTVRSITVRRTRCHPRAHAGKNHLLTATCATSVTSPTR